MAEYKFSCPRCGQHLECAVGSIGAQIDCPSCEQSIIIPSPKVSVSKGASSAPVAEMESPPASRKMLIYVGIFGIVVGLAIVTGSYFSLGPHPAKQVEAAKPKPKPKAVPPGADSLNLSGWVKGPTPPAWVKLVRSGNAFTGYYSTNDSDWTLLRSVNVPMSASALAGLAVSAHSNGELNTTKFDNVTVGSSLFDPTDGDVGTVGIPGSATQNNGVYLVSGSGADIFGADDQFNYDYQSVSGDVTLVARVVSENCKQGYAKSGVMFRESLATNSANVHVVMSPINGVCMEARMGVAAKPGQ